MLEQLRWPAVSDRLAAAGFAVAHRTVGCTTIVSAYGWRLRLVKQRRSPADASAVSSLVNQWVVPKRQTERQSRPPADFGSKGNTSAGAVGSRQLEKPRIMGVFRSFDGGALTG